jgi:site-specific recombinase XerC
MVERAGIEAKLGFKAHPHMLRHACGFALANKGHDTRALQASWVTAISSTLCAIPSCHPIGSKTFGGKGL